LLVVFPMPSKEIAMSKTVSDQVLERLHAWGVRRVFGYPGDGINGLMGAFERIGDQMRFVQARHEELAAFMACAHAKFTGEVGVCMATSGPGAIAGPWGRGAGTDPQEACASRARYITT
jgi:glyoxylate carboligase